MSEKNVLWMGAARDFVAKHKPMKWGRAEQVAVNYRAIVDGLSVQLSEADKRHIAMVLTEGENTSACAQALRKAKLLPEAAKNEIDVAGYLEL